MVRAGQADTQADRSVREDAAREAERVHCARTHPSPPAARASCSRDAWAAACSPVMCAHVSGQPANELTLSAAHAPRRLLQSHYTLVLDQPLAALRCFRCAAHMHGPPANVFKPQPSLSLPPQAGVLTHLTRSAFTRPVRLWPSHCAPPPLRRGVMASARFLKGTTVYCSRLKLLPDTRRLYALDTPGHISIAIYRQ